MYAMSKKESGVHILGTGGFLPGAPIANAELIERCGLNTTDEWIRENLGIRQRHWAPEDHATSDLAAEAARGALRQAGLDASELDHIILCTTSADWPSPAAANRVQYLIGARCPAEDKQNACAGFLYGLDHGARLVATGARYVLVIGADVKSRFTGRTDRSLAPIFADGAGAVVLGAGSQPGGLLCCELWADGSRWRNMYTPAGGSARPASVDTVQEDLHRVHMTVKGREIFEHAVEIMTRLSRQACERAGVLPREIDCFIPHQANLSIMKDVAANLEIAPERVVVTIRETANIVCGTVPFALDKTLREQRLVSGNLILMAAAGAGYSGAAAVYRLP